MAAGHWGPVACVCTNKSKKNTLDGIKNASGFIRSELAKRVNLRYTPELVFEIDETLEYGAKIDSILEEIKKKEGKKWL